MPYPFKDKLWPSKGANNNYSLLNAGKQLKVNLNDATAGLKKFGNDSAAGLKKLGNDSAAGLKKLGNDSAAGLKKLGNRAAVKTRGELQNAGNNTNEFFSTISNKIKLQFGKAKLTKSSKMKNLQVVGMDSGESGGIFQGMPDDLGEMQCAVCCELFVEPVSLNCGHIFCSFCIEEWKKEKNNCPVCRADITQQEDFKVLDECVDLLVEQFVSEEGKKQRKLLKEEREKAKKEAVAKSKQRSSRTRGMLYIAVSDEGMLYIAVSDG